MAGRKKKAKKKKSGNAVAKASSPLGRIAPLAGLETVNVIVETPKSKRNKFCFDEKAGVFRLGKVLPAGAAFPYDFGFVPGTRAEDGDPLDVLLLMDESAFPGCVVEARPIGVIEAEQKENGRFIRNDRVVAVAQESHVHSNLKSLADLNQDLIKELEHFFQSYQDCLGKEFRVLGARGPQKARKAIENAIQ